eukprot:1013486-Prymnesium_polylepis.1
MFTVTDGTSLFKVLDVGKFDGKLRWARNPDQNLEEGEGEGRAEFYAENMYKGAPTAPDRGGAGFNDFPPAHNMRAVGGRCGRGEGGR